MLVCQNPTVVGQQVDFCPLRGWKKGGLLVFCEWGYNSILRDGAEREGHIKTEMAFQGCGWGLGKS